MANNFLRYKYFLITRDAYALLLTQIQSILRDCTVAPSIAVYAGIPISGNISDTVDVNAQTTVLVTDPINTEALIEDVVLPEVHVDICTQVNPEVLAVLPHATPTAQSTEYLGVNAETNLQEKVDIEFNVMVRPMVWVRGLHLDYHVEFRPKANSAQGVNTTVKQIVATPIFRPKANARQGIDTEVKNDIQDSQVNIKAVLGEILPTQILSLTQGLLTAYASQLRPVKRLILMEQSCISNYAVTMYTKTTLAEMDDNPLSYYDNIELKDIDLRKL